jgi:hypothetical protein
MESLIPIITQLVAGAVGGNLTSGMLKQQAINVAARTIAGAIGGLGGGVLLHLVGGEVALTQMVSDGIGGLIGGGILSAIVGMVMSRSRPVV